MPGILVNRSFDGLTWGPPIATHVASGNDSPDKNWITCDNWPNSAGYGNCYEEYDNSAEGGRIKMQRSNEAMYVPTCGRVIGISPTTWPVTRPPSGRAPVKPVTVNRTAS